MLETLQTRLKASFAPVEAQFSQNAQKHWELRSGTVTRVFEQADIDDLLKSSAKPALQAKTQQEVEAKLAEAGEAKVKDDRDLKLTDEQQIEWHWKGKEWIPTKVTLLETSYSEFKTHAVGVFLELTTIRQAGMQLMPMQKIEFPRAEFNQGVQAGWDSAITLAFGPKKYVLQLPKGLWRPDPSKFEAPIWVTCTDSAAAMEAAKKLAQSPAQSLKSFIAAIGCSELPLQPGGMVPPQCFSEDACFARKLRCFVSTRWDLWYMRHIRSIGIGGTPVDGCTPQPAPGALSGPLPPPPALGLPVDLWWKIPNAGPMILPGQPPNNWGLRNP
jgi:hypothetical protein